jgi:plasmid stabilization system protein ParE
MTVRFHPAARAELIAAAEYLDERRVGLGLDLIEEAERTAKFAADFPQLGRPLDRRHRSIPFPRFSYLLVYRIEPSFIHIIAVAHKRRRPGYWRSRQ